MKTCFAIVVAFLAASAIAKDGPPADDEKWEKCNDRQDAGLEQLANQLNKEEFYVMKASDPCSRCNVSKLGTVGRNGDSHFKKMDDVTTKHDMKVSFDELHIICECEMKNPSGEPLKGLTNTLWKKPEIALEMVINSDKKTVQIPKSDVLSPVNQETAKLTCEGSKDYIDKCVDARDQGAFDKITKDSVQTLFPGESTNIIQSDGNLLLDLNCENC